jgi:enamine deaminase RidA (YjgF/YER057c/UK114 family)
VATPPLASRRIAEQRFAELGLADRSAAAPVANYVPAVEFDGLVFTAGNGPLAGDGTPTVVGRLGAEVGLKAGADAARLATANLVTSLRRTIGSLDRVSAVGQVRAYLRCAPGFDHQDDVSAAAVDALADIFGADVATPIPTVISVTECVLGLPVTIDAVFAVDPPTGGTNNLKG